MSGCVSIILWMILIRIVDKIKESFINDFSWNH